MSIVSTRSSSVAANFENLEGYTETKSLCLRGVSLSSTHSADCEVNMRGVTLTLFFLFV